MELTDTRLYKLQSDYRWKIQKITLSLRNQFRSHFRMGKVSYYCRDTEKRIYIYYIILNKIRVKFSPNRLFKFNNIVPMRHINFNYRSMKLSVWFLPWAMVAYIHLGCQSCIFPSMYLTYEITSWNSSFHATTLNYIIFNYKDSIILLLYY